MPRPTERSLQANVEGASRRRSISAEREAPRRVRERSYSPDARREVKVGHEVAEQFAAASALQVRDNKGDRSEDTPKTRKRKLREAAEEGAAKRWK